jgi:hypothetical protein
MDFAELTRMARAFIEERGIDKPAPDSRNDPPAWAESILHAIQNSNEKPLRGQ